MSTVVKRGGSLVRGLVRLGVAQSGAMQRVSQINAGGIGSIQPLLNRGLRKSAIKAQTQQHDPRVVRHVQSMAEGSQTEKYLESLRNALQAKIDVIRIAMEGAAEDFTKSLADKGMKIDIENEDGKHVVKIGNNIKIYLGEEYVLGGWEPVNKIVINIGEKSHSVILSGKGHATPENLCNFKRMMADKEASAAINNAMFILEICSADKLKKSQRNEQHSEVLGNLTRNWSLMQNSSRGLKGILQPGARSFVTATQAANNNFTESFLYNLQQALQGSVELIRAFHNDNNYRLSARIPLCLGIPRYIFSEQERKQYIEKFCGDFFTNLKTKGMKYSKGQYSITLGNITASIKDGKVYKCKFAGTLTKGASDVEIDFCMNKGTSVALSQLNLELVIKSLDNITHSYFSAVRELCIQNRRGLIAEQEDFSESVSKITHNISRMNADKIALPTGNQRSF